MSRENVEVVRRAAEAFANEGIDSSLRWTAEDAVAHPFPEWVGQQEYRGHAGMRALLAEWTDNFDDITFEVGEFFDAGDRVVGTFEMSGQIKGSGAPLKQTFGCVSGRIENGKVGEIHYFLTVEEAFAAAGLDPDQPPIPEPEKATEPHP